MFTTIHNLNTSEKNVVYKEKFQVKTSFDHQFNEKYLILCRTNILAKYFIEAYKDNTLRKCVFMIDLDHVDQIDLCQRENIIFIKNDKDYCKIQAENKKILKSWMKVLCQNCGFNKIFGKNYSSLKENVKENKTSNFSKSLVKGDPLKIEAGKLYKTSGSLTDSEPKNAGKSYFQTVDENLSMNSSKSIVGLLATSVGSINLLNPKLDVLFNKQLKTNTSYLNINLGESDFPNSYVNLEECKSGSHKTKISDDLSLFFTKIPAIEPNNINVLKSNLYPSSDSLDNYAVIKKGHLDESDSLNFQDTDRITTFKAKIPTDSICSLNNIEQNNNFKRDHNKYPEEKTLKYIPLEVVNNSVMNSERDCNEKSNQKIKEDFFKKSKTEGSNKNVEMFYTGFDKLRSDALKNILGKSS